MTQLCEDTGLTVTGCAHCRGVTKVDMDGARYVEVELDTSKVEAAAARMARHRPRQYGKAALSELGQLLLQTADLYAQLGDGLTGTRAGGDGDRVASTSVEAPLPVDTKVVEHRHLLLRGLRWWVAKTHRGHGVVVSESVPRLVALLVSRLHQLTPAEHSELRGNLLDWRRGAGRVTDLPKLRGSIPLPGGCPNAGGELWSCDGELRAMLPADRDRQPWLSCKACGGRWDVTELPEAANVTVPVHVAAQLLDVSVRTIQRRTQRDAGVVKLGDVLRTECAL